jgi:argininosuccinate lyase
MKAVDFNYERMQASAQSGYMNAFAAATYLSERGVPFRSAHEIVGKAVQLCLEKNCELQDLSLDELRQLSPAFDQDVYERLTVSSVLSIHDVVGGTAPNQVKRALAEAKQRIAIMPGVVHAHA